MALAATIIIAYAASSLHDTAVDTATKEALAIAESNAAFINEEIELAQHTARTLAQILVANKTNLNLDRDQVNRILQNIIDDNKAFAGVYTVWEPNAFDGNDADYAGVAPYADDGRFILYWSRSREGDSHLESALLQDNTIHAPHYSCSKETKLECITDPHPHPEYGEQLLVTSLTVPIISEGQLLGIVGVDIGLDFFQRLTDNVDIYNHTGVLALITYNGIIAAASHHPEFIGLDATNIHPDFNADEELQRIQQGKQVAEFNEQNQLEVFVPIHFLRTWTPWSVTVIIPGEKITATATRLMWQMIAMGVVMTLAGLALLWVIAKQIATPIQKITVIAQSVAEGNLHVTAESHSKDETGILAQSFNTMVSNLRHMIDQDRKARTELEQKNADQQRLLDLVATLETPAIPIAEGVLFAPVFGSLDSHRSQRLTERLLDEVHTRRIRKVILDITGVVTVDTQVAHALLQLVQALKLLGCKVVITGISAAVATTITELGVQLTGVETYHSPQEVLVKIYGSNAQEK
jgi:methyl-accepting chemotaxis protein